MISVFMAASWYATTSKWAQRPTRSSAPGGRSVASAGAPERDGAGAAPSVSDEHPVATTAAANATASTHRINPVGRRIEGRLSLRGACGSSRSEHCKPCRLRVSEPPERTNGKERSAVTTDPAGMLIAGGSVISGRGDAPRPRPTCSSRATSSSPWATGPVRRRLGRPDVEHVDATGLTVMPGLIDAHCHITFGEPASNDELFFHRDQSTAVLLAAFNVPKLLRAGRDRVPRRRLPVEPGPGVARRHRGGDRRGPADDRRDERAAHRGGRHGRAAHPGRRHRGYAHVMGDRAEMVRTTRQQIKYGADWIKIHVTGSLPEPSRRADGVVARRAAGRHRHGPRPRHPDARPLPQRRRRHAWRPRPGST